MRRLYEDEYYTWDIDDNYTNYYRFDGVEYKETHQEYKDRVAKGESIPSSEWWKERYPERIHVMKNGYWTVKESGL